MTLFREFCELCERLSRVSERTVKVRMLANFLRSLSPDEIAPTARMLIGKLFPEWSNLTLGISWSGVIECLKRLTGASKDDFLKAFSETGDPGDMARLLLERKGRSQTTLLSLSQQPLSVLDVYSVFERIARISGEGSRERKKSLLFSLLSRAEPLEAKYIVKLVLGEMRTGVNEGTLELAIAEASRADVELVRRANMLLGDIGEVAEIALTRGVDGLRSVRIQLFRPIKPMLAEQAESVTEALAEHGGVSAFEYKLDGARVQIHKRGSQVRIFSRRLTDVTASLPEVVEIARTRLRAGELIVEGEVIAVGSDGKPLPFQYLVRRFRRVRDVRKLMREIPVRLYLFDCLYVDGEELLDRPYSERWDILSRVAPADLLVPRLVTRSPEEAQRFYEKARSEGHEGLVAKRLNSPYIPGRREKHWLKIKPARMTLDCVIVAADWGYGRRKDWLSDYYLAVRDEQTGEFVVVGKTFKGLTDEEFREMTRRLLELKVSERGRTVYVRPEIVVEVAFDEIQKSPKWPSGYALRFARIVRVRWDKRPEEADTLQRVIELYERQFKEKARPHSSHGA